MTEATLSPSVTAETGLVELCLPAHLLALMAEQIACQGWALRADINRYLNAAAVAPLAGLDRPTISRLARRVDELARSLLHGLAPEEPRQGMITCALFTLTLADERLFPDARNQAVLASLLLIEEARLEGDWRYDAIRARSQVGSMLIRARLQGYYLPVPGGGSV